jgi:hypothetical protein
LHVFLSIIDKLNPPLTLDADLEGLEPFETSTTAKDGHICTQSQKIKKYEIFNVNWKFQEVWVLKMPWVEPYLMLLIW